LSSFQSLALRSLRHSIDPTKWANTSPKLPAGPEAESEGTEDSPLS
jgi:hypothetical protein